MKEKPLFKSESRFWTGWDWTVAVVAIFRSVEIPALVTLRFLDFHPRIESLLNLSASALLLADIILRLQRSIQTSRGPLHGAAARKHYLRTFFAFDLVGSIPWGVICNRLLLPGSGWTFVAFLCLFRLARVASLSRDFIRTPSRFFILRRLGIFLLWIGLVVHLVACGWVAVGGINPGLPPGRTYIRALYWSVTTLSTTGFGDITPKTEPQMIYTMLAMIMGAGLYATVIANIASLITRADTARAAFDEKMERLHTLMKYKKMPDALQRRIFDYHQYLWKSGLGHDHETLLKELSPALRRSVGLFLNHHILEQVPMLKGANTAILHRLISNLHTVVYTPGDVIIHHGETGTNMYLINRGEVEVLDPQQGCVATLREGEYFGELALLDPERPRQADVVAKTFCVLSMIDAETFTLVLRKFPEFAAHVRQVAARRLAESDQRAGRS
ncbi:MAG: hypothetical protein EB090_05850 [Verrucomicrobia bacterium]|nr:hypothetical protein [Verrucomicrobiota bacterium]